MAPAVPEEMNRGAGGAFRAGKQILDIVTSGMYTESLMAVREYVQNAVDAIDEGIRTGVLCIENCRVDVMVGKHNRSIVVQDNGVGIPKDLVLELLGSVAISSKGQRSSRGFRGIGRLGGLGYCDSVTFETRSRLAEPVSVVTWDGEKLRHKCRSPVSSADVRHVVRSAISIRRRQGAPGEGGHFFRVTMHGVHQFHKDQLMDGAALKAYLGRVAPVPFDSKLFPLADKIEGHVGAVQGYRTYALFVDGDRVLRPHSLSVRVHGDRTDTIDDVELITLRGRNGEEIGRGWYAKMGYLAAVPSSEEMRGVRLRQGNIEVGDEHYLASFFSERRFAVWHIGEIHIGYALRVNARRDGFENSPDLEALFEQSSVLGRHLSYLCRTASKVRSQRIATLKKLDRIETLIRQTLYLSEKHLATTLSTAATLLGQATEILDGGGGRPNDETRLRRARKEMNQLPRRALLYSDVLDGRRLRRIGQKELIGKIVAEILENRQKSSSAEELVAAILRPYMRPRVKL